MHLPYAVCSGMDRLKCFPPASYWKGGGGGCARAPKAIYSMASGVSHARRLVAMCLASLLELVGESGTRCWA